MENGKWYQGGTVEEAIKKALSDLKVSRDEIVVDVVNEEKRGLFGMEGAEPAKILVVLKRDAKISRETPRGKR